MSYMPPIQFALLHSIGAASLLFVVLRFIKDMNIKAKDVPKFIRIGRSTVIGISFLIATWMLTSIYIFSFNALLQLTNEYVESFLWTLTCIGSIYASIGIFGFLTKAEIYSIR